MLVDALRELALASGASSVCLTEVHAKIGNGGTDLAKAVVAVQDHIANGDHLHLYSIKILIL